MNWTDEQAVRIGYLMIRDSPELAEDLWVKVGIEKNTVMKHNLETRSVINTAKYQQDCNDRHQKLYRDVTTDKRSWLKKKLERWI